MLFNFFDNDDEQSHKLDSSEYYESEFLLGRVPFSQTKPLADLYAATSACESFRASDFKKISQSEIYMLKKVKLITMLRVNLTMFRNQDKDLSWLDLFALYELVLRIERDLVGQSGFLKKYGRTLEVLIGILSALDWAPTKPQKTLKLFSIALKALPEQFFFKDRNIETEKSKYRKLILLRTYRPDGVLNEFLPTKAYIGKGYDDKGTAKEVSLDGTPSWQEVAMRQLPEEDRL